MNIRHRIDSEIALITNYLVLAPDRAEQHHATIMSLIDRLAILQANVYAEKTTEKDAAAEFRVLRAEREQLAIVMLTLKEIA